MNQFEVEAESAAKRTEQYEVMKTLGKGTYGHCYKVTHKDTGEVLVLKAVSLQGLSSKDTEDTKNEARLMQQLRHDNIIRHVDSWCDDQWLFIVMEYAAGGDLGDVVASYEKTGPTLSEEKLWRYITDMANGLAFLHSKRVIHRDIKPSNIFLVGEKAVVADLGLGRLLSSSYACAYSKVGTPLYFSPEVCEEQPYDEKSDCWALGCLIYELATGQPPFVAANQVALARKVVTEQPTPLPSHFSAELCDLLGQMLCKNPKERIGMADILLYPSVSQTAKQLARERSAADSPTGTGSDVEAIKRVLEIQFMHEKQQMQETHRQQVLDLEHAMQSRIDQLTANNNASHKEEVLQLQKELAAAEDRVLELSDKYLQLQAAYKEERGARLAADERNEQIREVHNGLEESLHALTQRLAEAEASKQGLQEKCNREVAVKQELETQLAQLSSQRSETAGLHLRAAEQEEQIASLTTQLSEASEMLKVEHERVEQYETLLAVLQEQDEMDRSECSLEELDNTIGEQSALGTTTQSDEVGSASSLDTTTAGAPQQTDSSRSEETVAATHEPADEQTRKVSTERKCLPALPSESVNPPAGALSVSVPGSGNDVNYVLGATAGKGPCHFPVVSNVFHPVSNDEGSLGMSVPKRVELHSSEGLAASETPKSATAASPCLSSQAEAAEHQALQLLEELDIEGLQESPVPATPPPPRLPTELEVILSSVDRLSGSHEPVAQDSTTAVEEIAGASNAEESSQHEPCVDQLSPASALSQPTPESEVDDPLLKPTNNSVFGRPLGTNGPAHQARPSRRPSFSALLQEAEEQLAVGQADSVSAGVPDDVAAEFPSARSNVQVAQSPEAHLLPNGYSPLVSDPKEESGSNASDHDKGPSNGQDPCAFWAKETADLDCSSGSVMEPGQSDEEQYDTVRAITGPAETSGDGSFCMDDGSFDGILLMGSGPNLCEARRAEGGTAAHAARPDFKLKLPENTAGSASVAGAPGTEAANEEAADQQAALPPAQEGNEKPAVPTLGSHVHPMSAALGAIAQAREFEDCLDGGTWDEESLPGRMTTPAKGLKSGARSRSIALADLGLNLPPGAGAVANASKQRQPEFPVLLAWQKAATVRESKAGTDVPPRVSGTVRQNVWCNKERRSLSAGADSGLALFFRPSNLRPPVVRKVMVRRGCSPEFVRMEITPVSQLDATAGWWGLQGVVPVGSKAVSAQNPTAELVEVIIEFGSPNPVDEMIILRSDARFRHLMVVAGSPLKGNPVAQGPHRPRTPQAAGASHLRPRGTTPSRQRPSSAGRARPGAGQTLGARGRPSTPTRRPAGRQPSQHTVRPRCARQGTAHKTQAKSAEQTARGPLSSSQVAALLQRVETQRQTPRPYAVDPSGLSTGSGGSSSADAELTTAGSTRLGGLQQYKAAARPTELSNGLRFSEMAAQQLEASDGSASAFSTPEASRIEAPSSMAAIARPSTVTSKLLEQLTMVAAESRRVIEDTASPTVTPDSKGRRPPSPAPSRSPLTPTTRGNMPTRRSSGRKSGLRRSGKTQAIRRSGDTQQLCEEANTLQERLRAAVEILGGKSSGTSLSSTRARALPARRPSSSGRQRRVSST